MFTSNECFKLYIPKYQREVIIKSIEGFPSVMVYLDRELDGMNKFGVSLIGDGVPETNELTHVYNLVKNQMKNELNERFKLNLEKEKYLGSIAKDPLSHLTRETKPH